MVESLPEGVSWRMVCLAVLKRRVPSPSTNMPSGVPSPGMVTVVTVASRAEGRGRLGAEHAAIVCEDLSCGVDLKRRWSLRGLMFLKEKFAKTKVNQQTFGEVDSCCA